MKFEKVFKKFWKKIREILGKLVENVKKIWENFEKILVEIVRKINKNNS